MLHIFGVALAAILSLFGIVGVGIYFRRSGRFTHETESVLLRLTVDLLLPCLFIDRILKTDVFSNPQNLWLPPLAGFGMVGVAILIGLAAGLLPSKLTGLSTWKQRRTFAACVGILNYGFVPIPLVEALFPKDDHTMGVLIVQNLGVELSVWTIVLLTMKGKLDRHTWKHVFSPPTVAIIGAVTLNLLGNSRFVPETFHTQVAPCFDFVRMGIHILGGAGIPLSILMVGATFSEHFHRNEITQRWKTTLKIAWCSCLIRSVIMPAIFILLAVMIPCTLEIKRVLVVHGAMGSAIFPMVLAKHYGGDPKTAFDTILSNTFLSIITLPLWVAVGLILVGG